MKYKVQETVGQITVTKEYEGTPEEIEKLIHLTDEEEAKKEVKGYREG